MWSGFYRTGIQNHLFKPIADLQQPSRDWQNMYVMAPQNNFIDLSGDFNIDNFVEWLLRTGMQNHLKPLNRSPRKQSAGF